jgi:protein O-mannosyl-transferase
MGFYPKMFMIHLIKVPEHKKLRCLYLFAIIAFVLYANSIFHHYCLDDKIVITHNTYTTQGIKGIPDLLGKDSFAGMYDENKLQGGRYRPLSLISFALMFELFGLNPIAEHILNIFLYILTAYLLFRIISRFSSVYLSPHETINFALLSVIIFLVHPIHTEVVANIKGRDEILALIFLLLSIQWILNYLEKKKGFLVLLASLSFLTALLSKEHVAVFLIIIPILLYIVLKPNNKSLILLSSCLLFSFLVFLFIRISLVGINTHQEDSHLMNNPFIFHSFTEKWASIIYITFLYIKLLFVPHPLTHDYYPYHIAKIHPFSMQFMLAVSVLIFILISVFLLRKRKALILYLSLFFVLCMIPYLNILYNIGTFMNERFLYTASISFSLLMAWIFTLYIPKISRNNQTLRYMSLSFLCVMILLFSIKTISRNKAWKNDYTLFTTDVKISSESAKANKSAGSVLVTKANTTSNAFQKTKYLDEAIPYLQKAIKIYPGFASAYLSLSDAYYYKGLIDSSITTLKTLILLDPNHETALSNLGLAYGKYKNDNFHSALYYERAIQVNPKKANYYEGAAIAYANSGNFEKALSLLEKGYSLDPTNQEIYNKIYLLRSIIGSNNNVP